MIPKQVEENGLEKDDVKFDRKAISQDHQRIHAGSRTCGSLNARSARSAARSRGEKAELEEQIQADEGHRRQPSKISCVQPRIFNEGALKKDQIGTVTGLAWTAVGGDILFIEALKDEREGQAAC